MTPAVEPVGINGSIRWQTSSQPGSDQEKHYLQMIICIPALVLNMVRISPANTGSLHASRSSELITIVTELDHEVKAFNKFKIKSFLRS